MLTELLNYFLKRVGSKKIVVNEYVYDKITPCANYSPWLTDKEFLEIYQIAKSHTLVDLYRCYELWELTEQIFKLNKNASFIEIGVWRGGTASVIGKKLELLSSNTKFYLADTFKGVSKASNRDFYYSGGEHSDTSVQIVKNLTKNNYRNIQILEGVFPDETAHLISDDVKFGFCHIDVDVYESARDIVNWIWHRMIPGGMIVFDDYGFHTCNGITNLVNEYKAINDRIVIYNLNGHAILIKLA